MNKHKPKRKFDEITLVFIVAIIIIIISLFLNTPNKKNDQITFKIIENLQSSLLKGNDINEYRLKEMQDMDYSQIKESVNIEKDFCIKLVDENGNPIFEKGAPQLNNACK